MWQEEGFSKLEKNYLWFFLLLLLFSFFYQLGIYPLFLEEPRRGLIALEMMHQENIWVPTQTGDLYFRKPPIYNWVLIFAYKLFGETEFATRFFSVLSHLFLGALTYVFSKKYIGKQQAVLMAFSYLLCADILYYFSALGEIDLFYALVTGGSIFLIYHLGEQKKYWKLFLSVYALTAIGFLTKGLSSLPYTAISLLVYFIWTKDFKKLISLQHFTGIAFFLLLLFGYFFQYAQYEDVSGWWRTLYSESAEKAAGKGLKEWLVHLFSFPLDHVKNLLPAAMAVPFLFNRKSLKFFNKNRLVWYSVLVFFFNFAVYWFSSEGRSRYVYPVFPFASIALVYLYSVSDLSWKHQYLKVAATVIFIILLLGFGSLPFLESLDVVDYILPLSIVGLVALGLIGWLFYSDRIRPYLVVLGLFIILRLAFSFIVPQTRERTTGAAQDKARGIEMAALTQGEPLYRLGDVRISYTTVFYLERDRGDVLYQTDHFEAGYYFCYEKDLPEYGFELIRELEYHGEKIFLIHYLP